MSVNIESIKAKLKNYSQKNGKIHDFTLTRFLQERFLYRLSKSKYNNKFFLKGGALIYSITKAESRPTLDIDLLGVIQYRNHELLKNIFIEIAQINVNDGVEFTVDGFIISEIKKEGNYSGIRIKIPAKLGNIKKFMQIDIGFGDIITPAPVRIEYPTLLKMPPPILYAYSIETLLAEKFHAMIDLGEANSRMKDFYDIYTILKSKQYNNSILKSAIQNTFIKRDTLYTPKHPIFQENFHQDQKRTQQWKAFLKKSNLDKNIDFMQVMIAIKSSLKPIYQSIIA